MSLLLTFFLLSATKSWYISRVATPGFSVIMSRAWGNTDTGRGAVQIHVKEHNNIIINYTVYFIVLPVVIAYHVDIKGDLQ